MNQMQQAVLAELIKKVNTQAKLVSEVQAKQTHQNLISKITSSLQEHEATKAIQILW